MFGRKIVFSKECDAAAEILGGYEQIDGSLDGFLEALDRNPHGFPKVETDWGSVRYIRTRKAGNVPPLLWRFTIDREGSVEIVHVEEYQDY